MRQLGGVLVRLTPAKPGEVEGGPETGSLVDIEGFTSEKPEDTPIRGARMHLM